MEWRFSDDLPIYQQIMSQIKSCIAAGIWKPGDKLPSVRELALEAEVNPNTMQKALSELEREGLLYSQRTAGRFVSDNDIKAKELQEEMMKEYIKTFLEQMEKLGYTPEETVKKLKSFIEDK